MRLFQTKLKRLQEADYDNDDFAIGSTVDNNNEDDFWDTICWILVSAFSIILQGLNKLFLTEQSLQLTQLNQS